MFNGNRVPVWEDENFLRWMVVMAAPCECANAIELHLKMVNMVNFMYILLHTKHLGYSLIFTL